MGKKIDDKNYVDGRGDPEIDVCMADINCSLADLHDYAINLVIDLEPVLCPCDEGGNTTHYDLHRSTPLGNQLTKINRQVKDVMEIIKSIRRRLEI